MKAALWLFAMNNKQRQFFFKTVFINLPHWDIFSKIGAPVLSFYAVRTVFINAVQLQGLPYTRVLPVIALCYFSMQKSDCIFL